MFKFKMRATGKDSSGYYIARWDRADSLIIHAENKDSAIKRAKECLGKPEHPYDSWGFAFDEITDLVDELKQEQE